MAKQVRLYLVLIGLVAAVILWAGLGAEDPPAKTGSPWPEVSIEGLVLPATPRHVGFAADSARPRPGSSALTLGGHAEGLDLVSVSVDLSAGYVLRGSEGSFVADRLTLHGRVWIERAGARRLTCARAELQADRVRFPGQVVFHRAAGDERRFDSSFTRAQLLEQLGR